jgi:hypothetical protein
VRFLRAHGVAIVATLWLLALLAGAVAVVVIAAGIPLMVVACWAYAAELRERRGR